LDESYLLIFKTIKRVPGVRYLEGIVRAVLLENRLQLKFLKERRIEERIAYLSIRKLNWRKWQRR
jgi:hypothetical protein